MEDETIATNAALETLPDSVKEDEPDLEILENGKKNDEEDSALEGGKGFTEVEQESDSTPLQNEELAEAEVKNKQLRHELEEAIQALEKSESEKEVLKLDAFATKDMLEQTAQEYEDLKLSHKELQNRVLETEEKYSSQLSVMQEALQSEEGRHKELVDVKEAFDSLSAEVEKSKEKMEELEAELSFSTSEARKFEDLYKQSSTHAESETNRASELERLLEVSKSSAKEMEDQMALLQEEVKGLYEKIAENQKLEDALSSTAAELSRVQKELGVSQSLTSELVEKLSSNEANFSEIAQELARKEALESQLKEDISSLASKLGSVMENLNANVSELDDVKLRLLEEAGLRETVQASLKAQEDHVSKIYDELEKQVREKEELERRKDSELQQVYQRLAAMESESIEFQKKIRKAENTILQVSSDNELLVHTNMQLRIRVNEIEDLLNSSSEENNATSKQLISDYEARIWESEQQLHEITQKFTIRDTEANELLEKVSILEKQKKSYEVKVHDASALAGIRKDELEEICLKLMNAESVVAELKAQISSLSEDKQLLSESYEGTKKELEALKIQLDEIFNEKQEKKDALVADPANYNDESAEKLYLQAQIKELNNKLLAVEEEMRSEKEAHPSKELELEVSVKHGHNELDAKTARVVLVEQQLKELNEKLKAAEVISKASEGMEVKSRDIEELFKKSEATSSASTLEMHNGLSPEATLKFILGVALVSVIVGIILGKRY